METNRRKFLGLFGAGAVAGPKLAAGIAESVAQNMPMPPPGMYSGGQAVSDDGRWRLKHIANLKKIISGKDPSVARDRKMQRLHMADNCERVRLDGLRSVSPGHKMRMLVDGAYDRQARIRRADARFELSNFLSGED